MLLALWPSEKCVLYTPVCAVVFKVLQYYLFCQDIQKHFDKESDPEGYDVISVSVTVTFDGLIKQYWLN